MTSGELTAELGALTREQLEWLIMWVNGYAPDAVDGALAFAKRTR